MKADQDIINKLVELYNLLMDAHKRAPVASYVEKRLLDGEKVELLAGNPRWVTALVFSGSPDNMDVSFVINESLPELFQLPLRKKREEFNRRVEAMK